ncbi:MAG: maleylpyruvate isomerase family mycothiol-dependent enzyme, partial [Micromonosporaceae bacterium]
MDREQSWKVIERERLSLADLLESLTEEEWEQPSLCDGWRIRDLAAHVSLAPHPPGPWSMLVEGVRARGSFNRLNHDVSVRAAERPPPEIVADLRAHAGPRL